jgi:hypothetical protein
VELQQKLTGYQMLKLPELRSRMDHGQIPGFWAVFGVLAEKGVPRESVRLG